MSILTILFFFFQMTIAERCGQEEVEGSRAQEEPHPGHNRIVFQQKGRLEGSGNVAHQESQGNGQEPLAEGQVPSVEALPQEGQTQGPQILKSSNPQITIHSFEIDSNQMT